MNWRVVVVVVVSASACTPAPVSAFEDFYQATACRDVTAFRGLLCPQASQAVAGADDATLLAAFAVTRVVQRVLVQEQTEDRAILEVHDATGQQTHVTLERAPTTKAGWCVAGLQSPP